MQLLEIEKGKLQEASKRLVCALWKSGYISENNKQWLIYRVKMGDRTVYGEIRELLLAMAEELSSITY